MSEALSVQRDDPFPRRTYYYNLQKIAFIFISLMSITIISGGIYFGYISGGPELRRTSALVLLAICCIVLLVFALRLWRMKPLRPAVIFDCYGFQESRFVLQPIAWSYIERIDLKAKPLAASRDQELRYIEVLLKNDIPQALYKQLSRSQWLNFRKDALLVTILPYVLSNTDFDRFSSLLIEYYYHFRTQDPITN
ncbi:hypothetical protein [Rhizobium tumorigenes]|uniref:hypothetical protein n=1 Tax=Rhizobium tumorigenes TaxID=2041385 RepID=UPI00241DAFE5|nr:hypothetical protein [Rhizobium tumorigenes]WFS02029.1 hypothetical protein PR016_05260 [Rhizobium tumorigenes]